MDYLAEYEAYLTVEKNASANTLSSYIRDVSQYLRWLEGVGITPEQAAQADVEAYTKYLSGQGKSVATVTRSLASLATLSAASLAFLAALTSGRSLT